MIDAHCVPDNTNNAASPPHSSTALATDAHPTPDNSDVVNALNTSDKDGAMIETTTTATSFLIYNSFDIPFYLFSDAQYFDLNMNVDSFLLTIQKKKTLWKMEG